MESKKIIKFFGWAFLVLGTLGLVWQIIGISGGITGALSGQVKYYRATPAEAAGWIIISNIPFLIFFIAKIFISIGLLRLNFIAAILAILLSIAVIFINVIISPEGEKGFVRVALLTKFSLLLFYGCCACSLIYSLIKKQYK